MQLESSVASVLAEIEKVTSSEAVVGKPMEVGDCTVIPVSRLRFGFAVGVGNVKASEEGRGGQAGTGLAGGGVSVDPQAFIVVDGSGNAHLLSLRHSAESGLVQAIQLVPEVLERMARAGSGLIAEARGGAGAEAPEPEPEKRGGARKGGGRRASAGGDEPAKG